MKLPKKLQNKPNGKSRPIPLVPKKEYCPVCRVEIRWTPTNAINIFKGKCPKCEMDFTYMNGNIVGGIKVSN